MGLQAFAFITGLIALLIVQYISWMILMGSCKGERDYMKWTLIIPFLPLLIIWVCTVIELAKDVWYSIIREWKNIRGN